MATLALLATLGGQVRHDPQHEIVANLATLRKIANIANIVTLPTLSTLPKKNIWQCR